MALANNSASERRERAVTGPQVPKVAQKGKHGVLFYVHVGPGDFACGIFGEVTTPEMRKF
jgi:hypothetical protein